MSVRHDLGFYLLVGLLCAASGGAASGCFIINDDDDGGSDTANDTGPATSGSAGSESGSGGSGSATTASDETASDETAAGGACGWGPTGDATVPEGYVCGGEGEDPGGDYPMLCPDGVTLEVGGACSGIEGPGCCDAEGNAWYCGDEGNGPALAIIEC